MGHFRPLFLYFRLFSTVERLKNVQNKFCQWLDSNSGPLDWKQLLYQLSHNQCPAWLKRLPNYLGLPRAGDWRNRREEVQRPASHQSDRWQRRIEGSVEGQRPAADDEAERRHRRKVFGAGRLALASELRRFREVWNIILPAEVF